MSLWSANKKTNWLALFRFITKSIKTLNSEKWTFLHKNFIFLEWTVDLVKVFATIDDSWFDNTYSWHCQPGEITNDPERATWTKICHLLSWRAMITPGSLLPAWGSLLDRCCKSHVPHRPSIPHICHEHHERRSCKFFLAGVNFCRFNAENWQFTVYFVVIYAFFRCKFYSPKVLPV